VQSGLLLSLAASLTSVLVLSAARRAPVAQADSGRLVLAFYYAWYDQKTWNSGQVSDIPQTRYVSSDPRTMARHIDQARNAGIDALVLNWWGKGNPTEKNLATLLGIAAQKGYRIAVDFDINSPFMSGPGSYAENLVHLHTIHAAHPAYLRHQGRPVVFFYNVSRHSVSTWRSLRDQVDPNRQAVWISEGIDTSYLSVFDGHHLYSVTWPNRISPSQTLPKWGERVRKYNRDKGTDKLWVATVMPGYDDRKVRPANGFARSRDDGEYYSQCWQAAITSNPDWVIINSFNEWPEGTYIEPSQAYGRLYLDATRKWAMRFTEGRFAASAAPTPTPTARLMPVTPAPAPPTPTSLPHPPVDPMDDTPTSPWHILHEQCEFIFAKVGSSFLWAVYCPSGAGAGARPILPY
jgi:hypothetical protein